MLRILRLTCLAVIFLISTSDINWNLENDGMIDSKTSTQAKKSVSKNYDVI